MKSFRLLLLLTAFAFPFISGAQTCSCTNCPLLLPEFTSVTSTIDISGTTINNLNNPNQGVCAILLDFTSNQIMGLEMTLTSPAGQSVTLVGQSFATNQFTGGADWDIIFVPCAFSASPDAGFSDTWNNNQGWQLGGDYSGIYYPNAGCLEGFNTGTVNGTWTLTIENVSDFYTGTLFNWSIIFCDNQGIDCYLCESDGGDLTTYPDVFSCAASPSLNLTIPPVYSGSAPDPLNYGYTYIISENDTILEYSTDADLSAYPPGTYSVCGLSYLLPDVIYFPPTGTQTVQWLRDTLNNGSPPFCGDVSSDCLQVTIFPGAVNVSVFDTICAGSCVNFGGMTLCNSGIFQDTLTAVSNCDSIVSLHLTVLPNSLTILTGDICQGETFSMAGNSYFTPGFHSDTLQAVNGCDSIIQLNLTVRDTFFTSLVRSICQGDTLYAGNQAYTQSGNFTIPLTAVNGCDSTVFLQLTVINNVISNISRVICAGDSVQVGNSTYFDTGMYQDTLISAANCDSIVRLTLTVLDSIVVSLNSVICLGDTIRVGNVNYTTSGNYTQILNSSSNCDSIVHLNLTVLLPTSFVLTDTICAGDSLIVGNNTYDLPGTYADTLTGSNGCDSTVLIMLSVIPLLSDTQAVTICIGDTLLAGGNIYTQPGTYRDTLTSSVTGCDSIIVSILTVNPELTTFLTASICTGETYQVGDSLYNSSGLYRDTLQSVSSGCDSIVQLLLTVVPVSFTALPVSICQGDTVFFNGSFYTMAGEYRDTLLNQNNCDSIVALQLSVLNVLNTFLSDTICTGEQVIVGGQIYSSTGNYTDSLISASGCDSIVHLNLLVLDSIVINLSDTICPGASVEIGNESYSASGYYTTILSTVAGCDSIVHLNLTVPDTDTLIFAFICTGTSFQVGDSLYTQTGQYVNTLISSFGCDSTIQLFLLVDTAIIVFNQSEICEGSFLVVGDSIYTQAGIYQNSFTAITGCDSIVNTTLIVLPVSNTVIDTVLCSGEGIQVGNNTYIATGTYQDTLNNSYGCDSIVQVNLLVIPEIRDTIQATLCDGETYSFGGTDYTTSGFYSDTLTAFSGCDSIVSLALVVLPPISSYSEEIICEGGVFTVGDSTFSESGLYQVVFTAASGCDSTAVLDLTVFPNLELFFDVGICDGSTYLLGDSMLTIPGNYFDTLTTVWGCDSIVHVNLYFVPEVINNWSVSICAGDSLIVGDTVLYQTTFYTDTLSVNGGCDSIIQLNLTVIQPVISQINAVICTGDTFSVGNEQYNMTGIYTDTLLSYNGCDSIITLTLDVVPFIETFLTGSICSGYTYPVGDTSFSVTGQHILTLPSSSGCDSIITLDLVVHPNYFQSVNAAICTGDTFYIANTPYFTTGLYQQQLTSTAGCDSLILLQLLVNDPLVTDLNLNICQGESVAVGDSVYTETGLYQQYLIAQGGCDSIVNLNLTVSDFFETTLNWSICSGGSVAIGDSVYTQTGNYTQVFSTVTGNCDSIVHLNLTVLDILETNIDTAICTGETIIVGGMPFDMSGTYVITLPSSGGCDSVITLQLIVNPGYDLVISDTICTGESIVIGGVAYTVAGDYTIPLLTAAGCDSLIQLQLTVGMPDTIYLTDTLCTGQFLQVGDSLYFNSGAYINILMNGLGCDSIIYTQLSVIACAFNVTLEYDGNPCVIIADGTLTVNAAGGQSPYTYTIVSTVNNLTLTGDIAADNMPVVITGLLPGDYSITVTDANGITATQAIMTDIPSPVVANITEISDYGGFMVRCAGDSNGYATGTATGGTAPYLFSWDGQASSPEITNASAGIHTLIATDQNGCSDTLAVNFTAPPPLEVIFTVRSPNCFGDLTGRIYVQDVSSGAAPYEFALDSEFFTDTRLFEYLAAGPHVLTVRDAAGCEWEETVIIPAPEVIQVELGADIFLQLGDSAHIQAMINLPDAVSEINWTPQASCTDCQDFWTTPISDILYQVTVIDTNGCFDTDQVRIWIQKTTPVYIPTVFSPNGDGINDIVMIFGGDEVEYVNYFKIFDRFGEMVFEAEGFYPDDPSKGWDGNHRGEPMNPQVLVYIAEITMKDRVRIFLSGDITLVR